MRNKIPSLLILLFVLCLMAATGAVIYAVQGPRGRVSIIVAARDIREGERIQTALFRVERIDVRARLDSMLLPSEANAYLGYEAGIDIKAGDPVFKGALSLELDGDRDQLSPKITTGMRAISIPVDYFASVSRAIEPGDRVDLLVHAAVLAPTGPTSTAMSSLAQPMGEAVEPMTAYLFQDVKVMATDEVGENTLKSSRAAKEGYRSVTLELTPDEVSVVSFALFAARSQSPRGPDPFTLVLRNPQDDGYLEKVQVTRYESLINLANLEALFQRSRERRAAIYGSGYVSSGQK